MNAKSNKSAKSTKSAKSAADRAAEYTAIKELADSFELDEEDARMMRAFAKFTEHYSERNALLILAQRPSARDVAAYGAWQERGRQVRKGAKGIRILAPAGHGAGTEATPATESAPATEGTAGRQFFRLVSIFDISQTDPKVTETPEDAS